MPSEWAFPIAVIVGFLIVAGTSWDKFGEPTYTDADKKEDRYYLRFGPRFIALRKKYSYAKLVYVCFMCAIYLVVSVTPWLADFIPGLASAAAAIGPEGDAPSAEGFADSPAYPLAVAAGLMGFQAVPYLKNLELKCRRFLHTWAKIPKGAKETINKLWRSDFDFSIYENLEELKNREDEFETVSAADFEAPQNSIEREWAKVCCTLYGLRVSRQSHLAPGGFDASCYSDAFFEEFEPEYDEICRLYRNLGKAVMAYKILADKANGDEKFGETRRTIKEDIRSLLDQIYSFVACAVRSKQTTESNVITALNKLGYVMLEPVPSKVDKGAFILAALGMAVIFPLISFYGPSLFDDFQTGGISAEQLRFAYPYLPLQTADGALWAVSTIVIHIGAAWTALFFRARQIRVGGWQSEGSGRPIEKYAVATALGGAAGFVFLSLMTALYVWSQPKLGAATPWLSLVWTILVTQSLVWVPLPLITAGFAIYHRDTASPESQPLKTMMWILLQGGLMAVLAFLLGKIYTELNPPSVEISSLLHENKGAIELRFWLLTASVAFLIGAYLGWLFPYRRRSRFRSSFAGDWDINDAIKGMDYVSLSPEGTAQRMSADLREKESGRWKADAGKLRIEWDRGDKHTVRYIAGKYDKLEFMDETTSPEADSRKLVAERFNDPVYA